MYLDLFAPRFALKVYSKSFEASHDNSHQTLMYSTCIFESHHMLREQKLIFSSRNDPNWCNQQVGIGEL